MLHNPTCHNYASQSKKKFNFGYGQSNPNSGQQNGDTRPANIWMNNNYKSTSTSNQSTPSAMLTNAHS